MTSKEAAKLLILLGTYITTLCSTLNEDDEDEATTEGHYLHGTSDKRWSETVSQAPRCMQSIMMRLQKYDVEVRYEHGKKMHLPDMLSRAYLPCKKQG